MVSRSLWKLATRVPLPERTTLNRLTLKLERLLTHDFELQRRALACIPQSAHCILDVGCGGAAYHDRSPLYTIGLDINPKRLKVARRYCTAADQCDITHGLDGYAADVALCFEVIEHLTKDEGTKLLDELEKFPLVILTTPRHFFNVRRNGREKHLSFWSERELATHGYTKVEEIQTPPSNIYVRGRC